ncbi:GntR family transcriptional regulator [bacterium]|nr:GntR family transcriptional regulator [bacterium]
MWQFNETQPIYIQIIEYLKEKIFSGEIKPGEIMPSIRSLSLELEVNPNTIKHAYDEMEREGLVKVQRGIGFELTKEDAKIKTMKKEKMHQLIQFLIVQLCKMGLSNEEINSFIYQEMNTILEKSSC